MTPPRILLGIVVLATVLRLAGGLVVPMSTEGDPGAYLAMAAGAAEGTGLADVHGNRAFYSPGYPMLLAPVFWLTGPSLGAVLAVNVALAAVSVLLVYGVARAAAEKGAEAFSRGGLQGAGQQTAQKRLLPPFAPSEWAGLSAALAWAVYVPSIMTANAIAKENLMVPLMLALAWLALAWPGSRRRGALAGLAGLAAGVLALAGTTGCAVAGALAAVIAVRGGPWRQRLAAGGAFLLVAAAVLAPWYYRNYLIFGEPLLKTNPGFNFYMGNNPAATGRFVSISDTPMADEWHRIRREHGERRERVAERAVARRAWRHVRAYPGRTVALFAKKSVMFWEPPYLTSAEPESLVKRLLRYVWFAQYVGLTALAVAGLRNLGRTWPLYLAVALFAAMHIPFVVMLRYRLPIMAVLCACAFQPTGRKNWALPFLGAGRFSVVGTRRCAVPKTKDVRT